MKNLLLIFFFIILGFAPVFANVNLNTEIGNIELTLYGFDYKKETEANRLDRIEKTIFGSVNSKISTEQRIDKIKSALGLEVKKETEKTMAELQKIEADEIAKNASINYPVIDSLEEEFLKKQHKQESIYKRVERLEKTVFGAVQSGDLDARVEKLKASSTYTVAGGSINPQFFKKKDKDFYTSNYDDYLIQIAGLETSLFGKTFSQDPLELRLNRLERKIFQRDFSSDSEYLRLQRLQAASLAKKTSKYYDSNKLNKYSSTGMQFASFLLMILAFIL